jgi:hypothetical protein
MTAITSRHWIRLGIRMTFSFGQESLVLPRVHASRRRNTKPMLCIIERPLSVITCPLQFWVLRLVIDLPGQEKPRIRENLAVADSLCSP